MKSAPQLFDELLYLMRRLRDPETGCPWDLKQTFATIAPYTLEEVYEVIDTIERQDYGHLSEELGDLLFQIVFYSQLGEEAGLFDFGKIIDNLIKKLLKRHPHVFPTGDLHSRRNLDEKPVAEAIKDVWESIKRTERQDKGRDGILADIPKALPSLVRAKKLQKRAAGQRFDWQDVSGVLDKLREELEELQHARTAGDPGAVEEEVGDLLFTCVNLARHLEVDAETALRSANNKFQKRFEYMEKKLAENKQKLADLLSDEMEALWEQAKNDPN